MKSKADKYMNFKGNLCIIHEEAIAVRKENTCEYNWTMRSWSNVTEKIGEFCK